MKDTLGKFLVKWRVRVVLPHVKGRLLDIGCGTNELVKAYGSGTGVDVYQWGSVDLVVENAATLPFEDASFDTISIIAALNHIPNRQEVLKEACRLLNSGGKLIVTSIPPRISRVWHFLRRPWDVDQKERGMVPGEVYGFSRRELRNLIEAAGFRIVHQKFFMFRINCMTEAGKVNE